MSLEGTIVDILEDTMVFAVAMAIFGKGWYDKWLKHQERKMEIRLMSGSPVEDSNADIAQLKKEIDRLRDTTTQYDVSIDHTLHDLSERLRRLESDRQIAGVSTPSSDETVRIRNG